MFAIEKLSFKKEIDVDVYLMKYPAFDPNLEMGVLNETEKQRVKTFGSIKRQREFIAVRLLKNRIFGKPPIYYNTIGAPYISKDTFISISHSNNMVGIATSVSFIGLDLEPIDNKVHRVKDKFLSLQEKQLFNTDSTVELIRIWSAKEALYKLSGEKGLLFSENLVINSLQGDVFHAAIRTKNQHNSVLLHSELIEDTVISVNITPLRTIVNA
jgi:4'-phosphopantetheinyl transferase